LVLSMGLLLCCALVVGVPGMMQAMVFGSVLTTVGIAVVAAFAVGVFQSGRPRPDRTVQWRGSDFVACLMAGLGILGLQLLGLVSYWRIGE